MVQLETVEVKTHEEDETVVYKQQVNVFKFVDHSNKCYYIDSIHRQGKDFVFGETLLDKGTEKKRGKKEVKLFRW